MNEACSKWTLGDPSENVQELDWRLQIRDVTERDCFAIWLRGQKWVGWVKPQNFKVFCLKLTCTPSTLSEANEPQESHKPCDHNESSESSDDSDPECLLWHNRVGLSEQAKKYIGAATTWLTTKPLETCRERNWFANLGDISRRLAPSTTGALWVGVGWSDES